MQNAMIVFDRTTPSANKLNLEQDEFGVDLTNIPGITGGTVG
jgi:hypothetical protein